jgi:hypothetical protein
MANGTLLTNDTAQIIQPMRNSTLMASDAVQINSANEKRCPDGKRCCADKFSQ